ncbi:MAG TPA: aminotransferase class I/II-fold pyridoxal phosphate-dependent enzyme [Candidatus Dormibacteraeota bacterium]
MPVQINPVLTRMRPYPFLKLNEAKKAALARGVKLIDFSVGDPHERTDPAIREALLESVEERSRYPMSEGLPEHREAIAAWIRSRYGVTLDPHREVVPTLGSKEAIFSLAQVVIDPASERKLVVVTEPGYPIPERGAEMVGARVLGLPLLEANGFLPDLDSVPAEDWDRIAIFWINYPNNPTAAVAPLDFLNELAARAVRHGFLLASDEAYSEIYFGEPTASALQVRDRSQVAVFNTQSKRSSMTGYRAGFVAGPPELIAALKLYRPLNGTAVPEFIQRASMEAWGREDHVEAMRAVYAEKRALFIDFFRRKGVRIAGSEATFYLWCQVPEGQSSEAFATRLLESGVVVAPGSFFGEAGEGYFRLALVPTVEDCRRAIEILELVL